MGFHGLPPESRQAFRTLRGHMTFEDKWAKTGKEILYAQRRPVLGRHMIIWCKDGHTRVGHKEGGWQCRQLL